MMFFSSHHNFFVNTPSSLSQLFTVGPMNSRFSLFIVVFLLGALGVFKPAYGQLTINPQAGISASTLSTDPQDLESAARFGYQVGVVLRIGGKLYLQPGIFWQRSSTELKEEVPSPSELNEDIDLDAILITASLGYNLLDNAAFRLRINGGLSGTSIVNVQEGEFEDLLDFNTLLLGAPVGVGVDLFDIVSADISYEFGLTSLIDTVLGTDVDITNNVFRFNVGLVF